MDARYNGNVTTLLHSLREGGAGYGGVSANFYPWLHVWLMANFAKEVVRSQILMHGPNLVGITTSFKFPSICSVF